MVYGIIELINFAHGDVFMLGLFISLAWFTLLGVAPDAHTAGSSSRSCRSCSSLTMLTTAALNVDHRPARLSAAAPIHRAWRR